MNPTRLYTKALQHCIDKTAQKQGRLIHNHLITTGFFFPPNTYLTTKLIIFYTKIHDMSTAHKLFDKMTHTTLVSYTALLSGYSQNGNFQNALMVFSAMCGDGFRPNQFAFGSLLRACTRMMCLHSGMQVQGCALKSGLCGDLFVQSALVDLHSKCGEMKDACWVFGGMVVRDLVCWNVMIGGYAVKGFDNDAFTMFRLMLREGMDPDCFTFGSLLKASVGGSGLVKVSQIHGFIITLGFGSHNILCGSLIDAYAKCGSMRSANHIYENMPKKDMISCTALITGYAREGNCSNSALNLFNEVHQMAIGIDDVMLCSMLNICANTASLGLGRQMHALALKYQPRHDTATANALIDMYSKSGEIEDAKRVFDKMDEKNIISWTSLIAGYGKHGHGHEAITFYERMESAGLKPNDVTFLTLLFACSHNGLTCEGWECFNAMVNKYSIVPRTEHYSCMVDLFARGGRLDEAYNLICNVNMKPSASLWGAILGSCSVYGNMALGEVAARHLFNIEPENSANYVVLASMYAAAGLWDSAIKTRKLMEDRSLRKDPGYSIFQSPKKMTKLLL